MNISAAFLQVRVFNRKLFVKLLKKEQDRTVLWRLTEALHGLADSG